MDILTGGTPGGTGPVPGTPSAPGTEPKPSADPAGGGNPGGGAAGGEEPKNETLEERIDRLADIKAEKKLKELSKKNTALQKALEKVRKDKLSDDEIRALEIAEKEESLVAKEKELNDRELHIYALKGLKAAGLDDGSDKAFGLAELVMGESNEAIDNNIKALKEAIDTLAASRVDEAIGSHSRTPAAGGTPPTGDGGASAIAKRAQEKAAAKKQADSILSRYIGRK